VFVFAPPLVAALWTGSHFGGERSLAEASRAALAGFLSSGGRDLPADLQRIVDYWLAFHVVKAVAAAALLGVFGFALYKVRNKVAAVGVGALGLLSLAALMANIQGAVAPLSSLLTLAATGAPGRPDWEPVRQQLAEARITPTLDVLIGDFALFHAAMVVIAAVLTVPFGAAGVSSTTTIDTAGLYREVQRVKLSRRAGIDEIPTPTAPSCQLSQEVHDVE
jgi:hypothetical protein